MNLSEKNRKKRRKGGRGLGRGDWWGEGGGVLGEKKKLEKSHDCTD